MESRGSDSHLVLFSGDLFAPSNLGAHFKGEQMLQIFKRLNVAVTCLGNHDTDYGLAKMSELIDKTQGIWLMANLYVDGKIIGNLPRSHTIQHNGHKLGFFGLCEPDWIGTLNPQEIHEELIVTDFIEAAKEMVKLLKSQGCTYIIALTHMRLPNDRVLAKNCPGIDLILGGHDHSNACEMINGITIIKSGSDFEEFSDIKVDMTTRTVQRERVFITSDFKPDPEIKKIVDFYTEEVDKKLHDVVGYSDVELDGRFEFLRSMETNMGNWIADLILTEFTDCDVSLLNCGTLRSNQLHPKGDITLKTLSNILPMVDQIVQVIVPGHVILACLENAVSSYPKLEGRFAAVSGLNFVWDPEQPEYQRVVSVQMWSDQKPLNLEKKYVLAVKKFLASGKDGYTCLTHPDVKPYADFDSAQNLQDIVLSSFQRLTAGYEPSMPSKECSTTTLSIKLSKALQIITLRKKRLELLNTSETNRCEQGFIKILPQVNGRIKNLKQ